MIGLAIATVLSFAAYQEEVTLTPPQDEAQRQPAAEALLLRIYDVSDLYREDPLPASEAVGLEDAPLTRPAEAELRARSYRELGEWIERHVAPPLGEHHVVRTMENGTLVIQTGPRQHEWIEDFLELQRRSMELAFDLRIELCSVTRAGAAEILEHEDFTRVMPTEVADRFVAQMKRMPDTEVVSAPRLAVLNRQQAVVSIVNQVAYIADYRKYESVEPGGVEVIDPVVKVVKDGLQVEARIVRLSDEEFVLDFTLEQAELTRPIREFKTQYGTIGLPEVVKRTMQSELVLDAGSAAILPGLTEEKKETLIVIRARPLNLREGGR